MVHGEWYSALSNRARDTTLGSKKARKRVLELLFCDLSQSQWKWACQKEGQNAFLPSWSLLQGHHGLSSRGSQGAQESWHFPSTEQGAKSWARIRGRQTKDPQHGHISLSLLNAWHLASVTRCLIKKLLLAFQWLFFLIYIVARHLPASTPHRRGMVYIYLRGPKRTWLQEWFQSIIYTKAITDP